MSLYLPPVASTVTCWMASTASTAVPCEGDPLARVTTLACGLSPLKVRRPAIWFSWFRSFWTLTVSVPAPVLTKVCPEIFLTSTRSLPAPVLTRVSAPAGVSRIVKRLAPGPMSISRFWMPLKVTPPGSLAPTGPVHELSSTPAAA